MFGRKKKPTPDYEYPDKELAEMVETLADQQARKVVKEMLHLGCPTIVVTGSDGTTPAWNYTQGRGFRHTYQETEFVERGRWWAKVGEHRVLGELDRFDNTDWSATRFYKGYATPDAAQKAAEKWYENLPTVKVK